MWLSKTTSNGMSSWRTVFETDSKFANEGATDITLEDPRHQLDGEQMCSGPWDDWNLFARLTNSDINNKHILEEYVNYLAGLIETLPRVTKPPSRPVQPPSCPVWLRVSAYEDDYKTHRCKSSCPSLTDGSTLSGISSFSKSRKSLARYLPTRREAWSNTRKSSRPVMIPTAAPSQVRANIQTQFYEASDSDFLDSETSTDSSSDDGYDPFENLNNAIRRVFSFNEQLADKVIDYLVHLPPDRRAKVYGYGAISYGAGDSQESSIIASYGDNSRPTKRKRVDEASSDNLSPDKTLGGDDHDDRVLVEPQPREKTSTHRRFACGYNIFDKATYSPRNTRGRTATRYKSCAGPGFSSLNHYKRHLERVHTLHQCPRCGDIFDTSGELQTHLAQASRCSEMDFEQERGISQATWDKVKGILKRRRKAQGEPSDEERWFRVWDVLFPEVQRPPTAYFEESQMHSAYQARALEVFDILLTNQPELAPVRDHRDHIMEALRHALNVAGQGPQLDQEVGDQIIISPPPPSQQSPLLNSNARGQSLYTDQIAISEPRMPDTTNVFTDLSNHLEGMRYSDGVPIDDVALYGISGSIYLDVDNIIDDIEYNGLYVDPFDLGNQ
ncbi:hypothetical protein F4811DRAFT_555886 [Daldinia bambusicola]|nr:hypothetical protein F4811DRAFT_555886 [Daldinia bambusicola]